MRCPSRSTVVGSCARRSKRCCVWQSDAGNEDLENQKLPSPWPSPCKYPISPRTPSWRSFQASDEDDFQSCDEAEAKEPSATPLVQVRMKLPPQNKNRVSHYQWIEELLQTIVAGDSSSLCKADKGKRPPGQGCAPLFVVAGACPNSFCGMQAVLFSQVGHGVDFWFVKPLPGNNDVLDKNTLKLHTKGPYKNSPGRSKQVYAPLAHKFAQGGDSSGPMFGVDSSGRAFIEEDLGNGERTRLLIYLVWQEAWSSPIAFRKFVRGKICYQRGRLEAPGPEEQTASLFFARQYEIRDGNVFIASAGDGEPIHSLLPPDSFQEMYETHF
ncbi:unnamed protein product [Polarella glacialis]|uniref:Uncharacterized protein n=1 Tax=Polarella glacialis TaxID=89957 RepID=A0A813F7W9_POLGL|nr:unnamed protein product [Polarella glacialis]